MKQLKRISICIPCFNEEDNIDNTYREIKGQVSRLKKYSFTYLFVDNGSTDNTRKKLLALSRGEKKVKVVFLSRNFGPEASAAALFDFASGDATITLPCDLQDPASLIPRFLAKWEKGWDVVIGVYNKTEDDFFTSKIRKVFYTFFKAVSNIDIPVNASGVGLMDRKAVLALKSLPEKYRFFRGLRAWIGFKTTKIVYERKSRKRGKSSYSLISYFKHAERGIYGFSYLLLDILAYCSLVLVLLNLSTSAIYIAASAVRWIQFSASIATMLAVMSFGSFQLLAIGILGKYIQVIMEETKNRPTYIVEEKYNI